MMQTIRSAFLLSITLAFAACTAAPDTASLPFPTELPVHEELQSEYQMLQHDLSPLPDYHFRMRVPNDWKTLDTKITEEPEKDQPADVAIFRQPGAWMTDETAPINAEIAVSVVNVAGSTQSPAAWLQAILQKNAKGYKVLNKRLTPSSFGEVSDILISYTSGGDALVSRMIALRSGDHMFIITGSDTAAEYANTAEAFNVAIQTFELMSAVKE